VDDSLTEMVDDIDESKVKEKAKQPENHLLLDDVLESIKDSTK
jgi:hypothetical protein